jgi:mannitol/fructose-specific phosphotransferase system IIA component
MTSNIPEVLTGEMVLLGAKATDKVDAIKQAGELLVRSGCVAYAYVNGMQARERVMSTYLGNGVAIPHGELSDLHSVYRTGVSVLQLTEGVLWEPDERAFLVIGLASINSEHFGIMGNLVELLQMPDDITQLVHTADPMVVVNRLTRGRSELGWN